MRLPVHLTDEQISTASREQLDQRLAEVYAAEPALRPDPRMRDYQLTYPPAVHVEQPAFRRTPPAEEYLARLCGPIRWAGYYFHFGFCAYRCRYCFHYEIRIREKEELMERYVDALLQEARALRALTPELRQCLTFLGGGTPTALPDRLIDRFLNGYAEIFGQPESRMSTVEAKPVTATLEKLRRFREAGFRRVNFGVQTLDPALYAFHHHHEELAVAEAALRRAREAGFEWVNIDLITGLERQTPASWATTLQRTEALIREGLVDSVFIYPFHDDPRSRTFQHEGLCPEPGEVLHSDAQARALFESLTWMELGPRFFRSPAHAGCELQEVLRLGLIPSYGDTLWLGLGNSSYTVGDQCTYLNVRDTEAYINRVHQGGLGLAIEHFVTLDRHQQAARDLSFALLYAPFVGAGRIAEKYGADAVRPHLAHLRRWAGLGLGEWDEDYLLFTPNRLGKLLHQQMIPSLYLPEDRRPFDLVMLRRRDAGRAWAGY